MLTKRMTAIAVAIVTIDEIKNTVGFVSGIHGVFCYLVSRRALRGVVSRVIGLIE